MFRSAILIFCSFFVFWPTLVTANSCSEDLSSPVSLAEINQVADRLSKLSRSLASDDEIRRVNLGQADGYLFAADESLASLAPPERVRRAALLSALARALRQPDYRGVKKITDEPYVGVTELRSDLERHLTSGWISLRVFIRGMVAGGLSTALLRSYVRYHLESSDLMAFGVVTVGAIASLIGPILYVGAFETPSWLLARRNRFRETDAPARIAEKAGSEPPWIVVASVSRDRKLRAHLIQPHTVDPNGPVTEFAAGPIPIRRPFRLRQAMGYVVISAVALAHLRPELEYGLKRAWFGRELGEPPAKAAIRDVIASSDESFYLWSALRYWDAHRQPGNHPAITDIPLSDFREFEEFRRGVSPDWKAVRRKYRDGWGWRSDVLTRILTEHLSPPSPGTPVDLLKLNFEEQIRQAADLQITLDLALATPDELSESLFYQPQFYRGFAYAFRHTEDFDRLAKLVRQENALSPLFQRDFGSDANLRDIRAWLTTPFPGDGASRDGVWRASRDLTGKVLSELLRREVGRRREQLRSDKTLGEIWLETLPVRFDSP